MLPLSFIDPKTKLKRKKQKKHSTLAHHFVTCQFSLKGIMKWHASQKCDDFQNNLAIFAVAH